MVALEALREEDTKAKLCEKHKVHANQVKQWRQQLIEHAASAFRDGDEAAQTQIDVARYQPR